MKKKNLRISNLDEFFETFQPIGLDKAGAFEILGNLESELNTTETENIVLINYKDGGFALFESQGYTGYMSEEEPEVYYFKFVGTAS